MIQDGKIEQMAEAISKELSYSDFPILLMNPTSLYPTQTIRDLNVSCLNTYIKEFAENTKEIPICCTGKDGMLYTIDGHHRQIAAARNGQYIRAFAEKPNTRLSTDYRKSDIYDYEDVGGFRYKKYPWDKEKEEHCL